MARTTANSVIAILGDDYGLRMDGTTPDLTGFIATANAMVTRVISLAATKSPAITLSAAEAELVERWLAAHFYCMSDKPYSSRSTQGASGSFQGQTAQGLTATLYGQTALRMDFTGVLSALDKQARAGAFWLGKTTSEQLTFDERNS